MGVLRLMAARLSEVHGHISMRAYVRNRRRCGHFWPCGQRISKSHEISKWPWIKSMRAREPRNEMRALLNQCNEMYQSISEINGAAQSQHFMRKSASSKWETLSISREHWHVAEKISVSKPGSAKRKYLLRMRYEAAEWPVRSMNSAQAIFNRVGARISISGRSLYEKRNRFLRSANYSFRERPECEIYLSS